MPKRISLQQLMEMARDLDVPERELRPYLELDESRSGAFAPALRPNPALVDDEGLEADVFLSVFNFASKARRRARYRRKIDKGYEGIRIVSEGDSWFQYPILLDDVIDHLSEPFAVYSLGGAGHLLADMIDEDEFTDAVTREHPHVFLISGGGNDMVGGGKLRTMLHPYDPGRDPADYPNDRFGDFLTEIENLYRGLFGSLTRRFPTLRILCHGYDHAIPNDGSWLGKPMQRVGIEDAALQREIVRVLIDSVNDRLSGLAAEFGEAVHHVDCRGIVADRWHDELHPTDAGYRDVADEFRAVIESVADHTEAVRLGTVAPREDARRASASAIGAAAMREERGHPSLAPIEAAAARRHARLGPDVRRAANDAPRFARALEDPDRLRTRRNLLPAGDRVALERILEGNDLFHVNYLAQGQRASRAVCKVHIQDSFGLSLGSGSGFMVAPGLLLTNNHVLPSMNWTANSRIEFDYEHDVEGETKNTTFFRLRPEEIFATNPRLDFTFVAVDRESTDGTGLDEFGWLRLIPDSGKALVGEPVSIIQHPSGGLKQIALRNSTIIGIPAAPDDDFIHYSTDTEPGSSGSPVLNDQWQVVALHHAGVPGPGNTWIANEGVRVSRMFAALGIERADTSAGEVLNRLRGESRAAHRAPGGVREARESDSGGARLPEEVRGAFRRRSREATDLVVDVLARVGRGVFVQRGDPFFLLPILPTDPERLVADKLVDRYLEGEDPSPPIRRAHRNIFRSQVEQALGEQGIERTPDVVEPLTSLALGTFDDDAYFPSMRGIFSYAYVTLFVLGDPA